jgi:hypothetical protein
MVHERDTIHHPVGSYPELPRYGTNLLVINGGIRDV